MEMVESKAVPSAANRFLQGRRSIIYPQGAPASCLIPHSMQPSLLPPLSANECSPEIAGAASWDTEAVPSLCRCHRAASDGKSAVRADACPGCGTRTPVPEGRHGSRHEKSPGRSCRGQQTPGCQQCSSEPSCSPSTGFQRILAVTCDSPLVLHIPSQSNIKGWDLWCRITTCTLSTSMTSTTRTPAMATL
jgi:hypothetical protein